MSVKPEHGHGECEWCAGYEAAVRDLIERGGKSVVALAELRDARPDDAARMRLHGKVQGVDLMVGYAREMLP